MSQNGSGSCRCFPTKKGVLPMAENVVIPTTFDASKLERVEALLQDLKQRASAANDAGDLFMVSVYNDLLQVASPIVVRAKARLEREQKAVLNKAERELRKAEREARKRQQETGATTASN
jgi:hypothetical protein